MPKQKYAIPMKGVRLLRRVIKHILAEPKRYDQGVYGKHSKVSPCGTAACIAGWAVILDKQPRPSQAFLDAILFESDGDGAPAEMYAPGYRFCVQSIDHPKPALLPIASSTSSRRANRIKAFL